MLGGLLAGRQHACTTRIIGISLLMILPLAVVSGCGKKENIASQLGGENVLLPAEVRATKELLDASILLTLARPNPFLSLLDPVDEVTLEDFEIPTDTSTPTVSVKDPFEGLTLGGILYRDPKPSAILTLSNSGSRIVHAGDIINLPESDLQIRVVRIDKQTIQLDLMNPSNQYPEEFKSKTFTIPSLVGYKSGKDGSSKASSSSTSSSSTTRSASSTDIPLIQSIMPNADLSKPIQNRVPEEIQQLLGGKAVDQINKGLKSDKIE